MPLYEHVFLARQDISPQQVEGLQQTMKSIISENGGVIEKTEYWGLKNLSYKIKKNRKAHYSLLNINAPYAAVAEMERQIRINSDILRFMTIRVDEHEEGPSVMMRNKDDRKPNMRGKDRNDRRPPRGDNSEHANEANNKDKSTSAKDE